MSHASFWKSPTQLATYAAAGLLICGLARIGIEHWPVICSTGRAAVSSATSKRTRVSELAAFESTWSNVISELQQLTDPSDIKWVANAAAASVSSAHLRRAVEMAARHAPSEAMQELVAQLLLRWSEFDPIAASESAVRGLQPFLPEAIVEALFPRVLASDVGAAARFAAAMEHCATRDRMVSDAVSRWAEADWVGAIDWIRALPEGPVKSRSFEVLLERVNTNSVRDLAACVANLSADHTGLQERLAARWGAFDPASAAAWAEQLPPGDGRVQALACAAFAWGRQSPANAAGFAAGLPAGFARDETVLQVVSAWAHQDATAVAQWVGGFADGSLRAHATERLVSAWVQNDPLAAAHWLAALPDGRTADLGFAEFSRSLAETQPAAAFRWADAIGLRTLRLHQLESIARSWLTVDPAAAAESISRSDLSDAVKAQLGASMHNAVAPSP